MAEFDRRTLIKLGGITTATGLAGCTSGFRETQTEVDTETEAETTTANEETTTGSSPRTPCTPRTRRSGSVTGTATSTRAGASPGRARRRRSDRATAVNDPLQCAHRRRRRPSSRPPLVVPADAPPPVLRSGHAEPLDFADGCYPVNRLVTSRSSRGSPAPRRSAPARRRRCGRRGSPRHEPARSRP